MKNYFRSLIYSVYTKRLNNDIIKQGNVPGHIGLILDGNRRGSSTLGVAKEVGYRIGVDKFEQVLDWCIEINVKIISVWVFSTENFIREEAEIRAIMEIAEESTKKIRKEPRVHNSGIKVIFSGEMDLLPSSLQEEIKITVKETEKYRNYTLNICIGYGGRAEIINAVKKIAKELLAGKIEINDISEEYFSQNLYNKFLPDPDLIIRTSGEVRLSGFLLWQGSYSELYFTDVFWPLFRKIDFLRAIREYQRRSRRYGK